MFRKLCLKVKILEVLNHTVPCWVAEKKVVTDSNTQLPYDFNIIYLRTDTQLYDLNKDRWWM